MKLVSGIVDSGFFAQSALSAEVATKDSLGRNISETYLTGVDLTPYQTIEGMTAYQEAGSYLSANALDSVSGDWNEVSAKLDTTAFSDVSANFLTAVPDTYLQNTDLSTEDGKVTAISGIPLSAGDTSATTFIAGQGIKIDEPSAGTVRIGNDETVLYSGSAGTSAVTLSESFENFESIKLVHNTQVEEFWKPKAGDAVRYWHNYGTMAQGVYKMAMVHLSMPDTTHIANTSARSLNFPLTGTTFTASVLVNDTYALNTIREVIGINRISGNA